MSNHKKSVSNARPVLKLQLPDSLLKHPKINLKRLQLKVIRDKEIENENSNLLRKINQYYEKKSPRNYFSQHISSPSNNEHLPGISQTPTISNSNYQTQSIDYRERVRSLNWTVRKEQFKKIDQENKDLLERLRQKRSDYDVQKLKYEFRQQQSYRKKLLLVKNSNKPSNKFSASVNPLSHLQSIQRNSKNQFSMEQNSEKMNIQDFGDSIINKSIDLRQNQATNDADEFVIINPELGYIQNDIKPKRFNKTSITHQRAMSYQPIGKDNLYESIQIMDSKQDLNKADDQIAYDPIIESNMEQLDQNLANLKLSSYMFNNEAKAAKSKC
ncbi:UNKNOWN [Stylonychia lemnae]|uniref:Uncharacterized protein n=1 Tax=Stylonychia lemnae TaxID=5949 RepID=A0A078B4X4_STYLE|nr:UNKNOWN [Stylonychia lemnae]|eukprot:CDW89580.1 UNKNOWN [Stylonychia lemnae]